MLASVPVAATITCWIRCSCCQLPAATHTISRTTLSAASVAWLGVKKSVLRSKEVGEIVVAVPNHVLVCRPLDAGLNRRPMLVRERVSQRSRQPGRKCALCPFTHHPNLVLLWQSLTTSTPHWIWHSRKEGEEEYHVRDLQRIEFDNRCLLARGERKRKDRPGTHAHLSPSHSSYTTARHCGT